MLPYRDCDIQTCNGDHEPGPPGKRHRRPTLQSLQVGHEPFSAFLVIFPPIGLRKHVIADEEATVPNQSKGIVKSVIFASPGISEHEIKRLVLLSADELSAVGQFE